MIATLAALLLAAQAAAPPAKPATVEFSFEPKTLVENGNLQVMLGERATFHLEGGKPVLDGVEKGQLAVAHPDGAVTETFGAPGSGKVAAAVDGSAEKRATSLKIWNGTSQPVSYRAVAFVYKGKETVEPRPVAVCSVAPGETRIESWPAPIVAVGLGEFKAGGGAVRPCPATTAAR